MGSSLASVSNSSTDIITQTIVAYPIITRIIRIEVVRLYSIRRVIKKIPQQIKKAKAKGDMKRVKKLVKRAKLAARNKKDASLKVQTGRAQKKVLAKARVTAKVGKKI